MSASGPLAGIHVLEFSQIVAGPFAGIALSDLGADVVKVEPLEGEARRNSGAVIPNEGKYFQSLNRGKRSLTVDLGNEEGQRLIHRIVPSFDVVLLNYRAGVAQRLNIDYPTLSKFNPRLIYANITGFGHTGPDVTRAGSDIVAQAYSGVMAAEAKVDEYGAPQQLVSSTFIDRTTGLSAAMGICAALFHRASTGVGQELHVSLLQNALELLSDKVMREPVHDAVIRDPMLAEIHAREAAGARYDEVAELRKQQAPRFASHRLYYGGFHTRRGALVLGALTMQNRSAIRRILDMHDSTDEPAFNAADPENRQRIESWRAEIQQKLLQREAADWVAHFVEAGVPASVVNHPEDMAGDPQVRAAGMVGEIEHPLTGQQTVVAPLVRMTETPTAIAGPAPMLGQHTREVLLECGLDEAEVAALVSSSIIRQA